ncbi:C40 family peptidase [Myceligenerans indicum]|nr:C40 family peptidase [Myceligenerans indicum]
MSDLQRHRPVTGRHRAAHRPADRAAATAQALTTTLSSPVRRGVLALAASGAFLSTLASPAGADTGNTESPAMALDLDALSAQAAEALRSGPAVAVPSGAKLDVEAASITVAVTPAPEPEPEPEPEPAAVPTASPAAPTPTAADLPPSAAGSAVVEVAMRYLGVPYLWGGTTPSGFDCSGFTWYVFQQIGIDLPRTSSEQQYAGTPVPASAAQPGDLIWSPGHIGIYAGDGMQIEAPSPGKSVRYTAIWQSSPTYIRIG